MKKLNFNQLALLFIASMSLIAFVYLNTVKVSTPDGVVIKTEQNNKKEGIDEDEVKHKNSDINLPSIEVVKDVITLVQKFLPAAS